MTIDLNRYKDYVEAVTSKTSNNLELLIARLRELDQSDPTMNVSLLLTSATGLSGEAGEFNDIIKKLLFQNKTWNDDLKTHLSSELGDIGWYWVNACRALNLDPNTVLENNVTKLESRYPGGKFDPHFSENRKEKDL